ncbi:DUF397 domain-containing protein [Actinomadura fulvescens]|uniref:DUF397 domain-containing protein n=1 Tax=Actinomadura fulvescens TaxID=46160 RepID=A0ABN3QT06_9ACTN
MRPDSTSPIHWRTSAHSVANGTCVEIARLAGPIGPAIGVRDSTHGGNGPMLTFHPTEWRAFTARARAGGFDLA